MKRFFSLILAGLLLLACATCGVRPDTPAEATRPSPVTRPGLYTVDTKPEGPMLYPVMSKAIVFNPYGIPDYPDSDYVANSFKLVNEKWEDVTGYINGSFEYVYVNGAVYGIQISEYGPGEVEYDGERYPVGKKGEPYILGLDGKPIEVLAGLIFQRPHYCSASLPENLMYVTTLEAYNTAAEIEWGMWPEVGVFNVKTGKLQIPVEYTQLILLGDTALGVKNGAMYKLDHSGNALAKLGEDWFCEVYHEGDALLKVDETTYIDLNGEIALELKGIRGGSNFRGEYAYGVLGGPGDTYDIAVFFDRQGNVVDERPFTNIHRIGDYYLVHSLEVLDLSLQTVFKVEGSENDGIQDIVDGKIFVSRYDESTQTQSTEIIDGDKSITIENGFLWYDNGFFSNRGYDNLSSLYDAAGNLIFENARVFSVSGDGKFINVDNGKYMGYIDIKGDWVYRMNAAYFNLED